MMTPKLGEKYDHITVKVAPKTITFKGTKISNLVWTSVATFDPLVKTTRTLISDWLDYEDYPFFAFWVEDCMDPSIVIIRARDFEDAFETFCEHQAELGHYLVKDDEEVDEESTPCEWTDKGMVKTELFQGEKIELISLGF